MSCLTGVLQLLQVLTTLSGCNIYSYAEERRVFQLNRRTHQMVRAMHRFWLRPWLMVTFVMYSTYWVLEFLRGLTDDRPGGSERPLKLIYGIGLTVSIHQNYFIALGMAYYYRYHRTQMKQLLNGFVRIYHGYESICGRGPIINWWFFSLQTLRVFVASVAPLIKSSFSYVGFGSKLDTIVRDSALLFLCLQPFLLSVAGHLGILILYACYDIQVYSGKRRRSLQLLDYYRHLIRLRQNLDFLVRPIVWTLMLENILLFIGSFHLSLYDRHSVRHMGSSILKSSIFSLVFLHVSASIRLIEKEFGQFKVNSKKQPQLQIFWLFKKVTKLTVDKSELNVFNLDRGLILETLRLAWVFAMFTNSILLNSTARLKHFESVKYKKFL